MAEQIVFDSIAIQKILPHRYPFLMIDVVTEFVDGKLIVAKKNVTANEPCFLGHFPNRPVMPGVMMLEAMAQAAAILAIKSSDGVQPGKTVFLVGANDFKWKRMVVPGDTLTIRMEPAKKRRPLWIMKGEALVGDEVVASGSLSAVESD